MSRGKQGGEPAWDLPKATLRKHAYARSGHDRFTRMVVEQDAIAQTAHNARLAGRASALARTRSMFDGELAKLRARQADEAREKQELQVRAGAPWRCPRPPSTHAGLVKHALAGEPRFFCACVADVPAM
eukprot:364531-Chlamydomonas_euryale.AAC.16